MTSSLVCKRWKGVAENSKLWEDKKLVLEEGENMTLSCAVEVAMRRKIQTIQAISYRILSKAEGACCGRLKRQVDL